MITYHFIVNFVKMNLAHLVDNVLALKCDKAESCKYKKRITINDIAIFGNVFVDSILSSSFSARVFRQK